MEDSRVAFRTSELSGEPPAPSRPSRPLTIIEPTPESVVVNLQELWDYRELLYFLAWRDVRVRYQQTTIGILWAVIQPLSTTLVFTVFFGRVGGLPSDGIPYALFTFAALVPWTFFAHGLGQLANSVVANQQLITKVYFPRLAIPLGALLSGAIDFGIGFAMLLLLMLWYRIGPGSHLLWIAPVIALAVVSALGVGLWLSALNVKYRDVRHALPLVTQLWLFATPIAYPSSLVRQPWRELYALNPMVGVVEGFRWALLGTGIDAVRVLGTSAVAAVSILIGGVVYFRRTQATFADFV